MIMPVNQTCPKCGQPFMGSDAVGDPCPRCQGYDFGMLDLDIQQAIVIDTPIHDWFGLTYSSYFCIPRSALEALPPDWQRRFVALMEEAEGMGLVTPSDYVIQRRGKDGRFFKDEWANYRRPEIDHLLPECLRRK